MFKTQVSGRCSYSTYRAARWLSVWIRSRTFRSFSLRHERLSKFLFSRKSIFKLWISYVHPIVHLGWLSFCGDPPRRRLADSPMHNTIRSTRHCVLDLDRSAWPSVGFMSSQKWARPGLIVSGGLCLSARQYSCNATNYRNYFIHFRLCESVFCSFIVNRSLFTVHFPVHSFTNVNHGDFGFDIEP